MKQWAVRSKGSQCTIHVAPNSLKAAKTFGYSFSEAQALAYRYTPAADIDRTITITLFFIWIGPEDFDRSKKLEVQPSMTADRFVSLFHESFSDAPMERIGFYSCNDVCLLYRLVDYKFIEMRCIRVRVYKNRYDRILRQLAVVDFSLNLYPTALAEYHCQQHRCHVCSNKENNCFSVRGKSWRKETYSQWRNRPVRKTHETEEP